MVGQTISTIQSTSIDINNATFLQNLVGQLINNNLGYLSIAVTILVIIGGTFVYFNIGPMREALKKQEKDIEDLKTEAHGLLAESRNQSEKDVERFTIIQEEKLIQQKESLLLETRNEVQKIEKELSIRIGEVSEDKNIKLKEVILSEVDNRISLLEKRLEKYINSIKSQIDENISKIKDNNKELESEFEKVKRDVLELNFKKFLDKNQIGALATLLEKLELDIKRGWGEEDTLLEIKEYLENHSMPNLYLKNLQDVLIKIKPDYSVIKEQILKLASEKLFNPRNS